MKEKKKRSRPSWIRRQFRYVIVMLFIAGGLYYVSNRPPTIIINHNGDDMLFYIYSTYSDEPDPNAGMLMMYNPRTNQRQALMPNPGVWTVSPDGRIAYLDEDKNIVISDVQSIEDQHAIIETYSDMPSIASWSPNGNYLLYSERDTDFRINRLIVWDGEQSVDITPESDAEKRNFSSITWSSREYLAFTGEKVVNEYKWHTIYVWDGEQTIDITPNEFNTPEDISEKDRFGEIPNSYFYSTQWSLKQDLTFMFNKDLGDGRRQRTGFIWDTQNVYVFDEVSKTEWNSDGQLMLWYGNYDERIVNRWDGKSYINGQPIIEPIEELNIDSVIYRASGWAYRNTILYQSEEQDGYYQLYLWDGTNLSYVDRVKIGMGGRWWRFNEHGERLGIEIREVARGHQMAAGSTHIYVRDQYNNLVTIINAHAPAWSEDGYIALCAPLHRLSIYNGQDVILIEDSWTVFARWQSGQTLSCTNG